MNGWLSCPFCHHIDLPAADGLCPRCQQSIAAPSAPAPLAPALGPLSTVLEGSDDEVESDLPEIVEPPVEVIQARSEASVWASLTRWMARGVYALGGALGFTTLAMAAPRNRFYTRALSFDDSAWVLDRAQVALTGTFVLLGLAWMASAYFTASKLAGRQPVFSLRRLLLSWVPRAHPTSVMVLHVTRKLAAIPSGRERDRRWLISAWWWTTLLWAVESLLVLALGSTSEGAVFSEPGTLRLDLVFSAGQHLLTMLVVYDVGQELLLAEHLVSFGTRYLAVPGTAQAPVQKSVEWKRRALPVEAIAAPVDPECPSCGRATNERRCAECGAALWCGGYRVIRLLGERPYARTYLTVDAEGTAVVVKELSFSLAPNAAVLDAFEREAALLRALVHPQIPRFVDSFTEGSGIAQRFYLAQEFVPGRSLQAELAEGRFTEAEVKAVLAELLPVLAFLHTQSPLIIHRDVKPSNILRRSDGMLMLIDFGAARAIGQTLMDATLVGTFGYMPPQQLAGQVDASTDLYALGATALHLVSGHPPWELLRDDLSFELPKQIPISRSFSAYLKRLAAPQRKLRFPSATAALDALTSAPARPRLRLGLALGAMGLVAMSALLIALRWLS